MALIKCPECGREISDKASACPNCGMPIGTLNEETKVKVHFERKKAFRNSAIYGTIIIDGTPAGSGANGSSFDVMLSPGNHNVMIDTGVAGRRSTVVTSNSQTLFVPTNAKSIRVEVIVKASLNSVLFSGIGGEVALGKIEIDQ